jgi:hypothetical protein
MAPARPVQRMRVSLPGGWTGWPAGCTVVVGRGARTDFLFFRFADSWPPLHQPEVVSLWAGTICSAWDWRGGGLVGAGLSRGSRMIDYGRVWRNRLGRGAWVVVVLALAIGVAGLPGSGRAAVLYATSTSLSCQPTAVVVATASGCTATVADTVSRRVTPAGLVSFMSNSPGVFGAGGSCALAPTGTAGVASCQASYSPSAVASGAHTITAGYGGDRLHSASHGATSINVTAAQTTTPQPPTAEINAPADGRVVKLRSLVGTRFSCIEGSNGPGISSCVDSDGASGGRGHLLTRRLGVHTYKVMAASGDGQTGVGRGARLDRSSISPHGCSTRPCNRAPSSCAAATRGRTII